MAFALSPRRPLPKPGEHVIPRVGVRFGCAVPSNMDNTINTASSSSNGHRPQHQQACNTSPSTTTVVRASSFKFSSNPDMRRKVSTPTTERASQIVDTMMERRGPVYRSAPAIGMLTPRSQPTVVMPVLASIASDSPQLILFEAPNPGGDHVFVPAVEPDDCTFCGGRDPFGKGAEFLEKLSRSDQAFCYKGGHGGDPRTHSQQLHQHQPPIAVGPPPSSSSSARHRQTPSLTKSESPRFGVRPSSARQIRESQLKGASQRIPLEAQATKLQFKLLTKSAGTPKPTLYDAVPASSYAPASSPSSIHNNNFPPPPSSPRPPQLSIFNQCVSGGIQCQRRSQSTTTSTMMMSPSFGRMMEDSISTVEEEDDLVAVPTAAALCLYSRSCSPLFSTVGGRAETNRARRRREPPVQPAISALRSESPSLCMTSRPFSPLPVSSQPHHHPRLHRPPAKIPKRKGPLSVAFAQRHSIIPQPPRRSSLLV